MSSTLVLNASFEPLAVVPFRRAVLLVLSDKATVLAASDVQLRSASRSLRTPTVIRLTRYVRVPYRATVSPTRRNVLARDNHRCVYCAAKATTVDHVVPRSRGGAARDWANLRAACSRCNQRKADRLLSELGWTTPAPARVPTSLTWLVVGFATRDQTWDPYLSPDVAVTAAAGT